MCSSTFFFFKDFIYLYIERGEGKERNINVWLPSRPPPTPHPHSHPHPAPPWGPGPQLSMFPDWELNQQPLGSQAHTQSTEPHQLGPYFFQ